MEKVETNKMAEIAEAIATSRETKGTVQVDYKDYGYFNVKFEKGADVEIEMETGHCNVSGAWCNVMWIKLLDFGDYDEQDVDCDIEKLEDMVSEYMNN